jgi:hypothetical protein
LVAKSEAVSDGTQFAALAKGGRARPSGLLLLFGARPVPNPSLNIQRAGCLAIGRVAADRIGLMLMKPHWSDLLKNF